MGLLVYYEKGRVTLLLIATLAAIPNALEAGHLVL